MYLSTFNVGVNLISSNISLSMAFYPSMASRNAFLTEFAFFGFLEIIDLKYYISQHSILFKYLTLLLLLITFV